MSKLKEDFTGAIETYLSPNDIDLQRQQDLEEIKHSDASEFMKKAGAGFVAEQYSGIRKTSMLIEELEQRMFEKANSDTSELDTIIKVHSQLTRKSDAQAKNVLRLYQGSNAETSPLLKKAPEGSDSISKAAGEATARELDMMSVMALLLQNIASKNKTNPSEDE